MNKNTRDWIAALRSGEYSQTIGTLKDSSGFCCLGVACDLYIAEHDTGWDRDVFHDSFALHGLQDILPVEVADWLGIPMHYPSRRDPLMYGTSTLSGLNDNGNTFETIADLIEEVLLPLTEVQHA